MWRLDTYNANHQNDMLVQGMASWYDFSSHAEDFLQQSIDLGQGKKEADSFLYLLI